MAHTSLTFLIEHHPLRTAIAVLKRRIVMLVVEADRVALPSDLVPDAALSTSDTLPIVGVMVTESAVFALVGRQGGIPPGVFVEALNTNIVLVIFVLVSMGAGNTGGI